MLIRGLQFGLNLNQFPDSSYLVQIMNDYVLAFFDKYLKNEPALLLDDPPPYLDVLFMKKDGR